MSNLYLVIKREYLTRVRRKSFILATLLTPLGFAFFIGIMQFIFSYGDDEEQHVAVVDEGNIFTTPIPDGGGMYFHFVEESPEEVLAEIRTGESKYTGLAVVPAIANIRAKDVNVEYYSDSPLGLDAEISLGRRFEKAIRNYKIERLNLDEGAVRALATDVRLRAQKINPDPDGEGDGESAAAASFVGAGLGMFMGFLMYIVVIIYGMMVMRSVMEEKTNRIVEVIISTVRPTTLLLGKIIGVGLVGLTQLVTWMILIPLLAFGVLLVFGYDPAAAQEMSAATGQMSPDEAQGMVEEIVAGMAELNWWLILPSFILYFLGGYFTYAALFAAVGSAMGDDLGEGQSLTTPIMIPIIIAFYIVMAAMRAPNSTLATVSSFIPLFTPIVMPARLAFDPPLWQIGLSLVIMFAFAAFLVWLAGRIYRIGILNYGKAGSFKDLGRWMFSKY